MGWFRRKDAESMDPQVLLAQANAATPLQQPFQQPQVPRGVATGFRMMVQDVFSITGRGTVVTGRIETGTIATGGTVRLTRQDGATRDIEVSGIEAFRKKLDAASAGDNVGLLLRGVEKTDVAAGDVLSS